MLRRGETHNYKHTSLLFFPVALTYSLYILCICVNCRCWELSAGNIEWIYQVPILTAIGVRLCMKYTCRRVRFTVTLVNLTTHLLFVALCRLTDYSECCHHKDIKLCLTWVQLLTADVVCSGFNPICDLFSFYVLPICCLLVSSSVLLISIKKVILPSETWFPLNF